LVRQAKVLRINASAAGLIEIGAVPILGEIWCS
jgi:hypothetical protein